MDKSFLAAKAYPYLHVVASFIEKITYLENGKKNYRVKFKPEYHDNNINAWFTQYTNYDLSLYKFALSAAAEAAAAMKQTGRNKHWNSILGQLPHLISTNRINYSAWAKP